MKVSKFVNFQDFKTDVYTMAIHEPFKDNNNFSDPITLMGLSETTSSYREFNWVETELSRGLTFDTFVDMTGTIPIKFNYVKSIEKLDFLVVRNFNIDPIKTKDSTLDENTYCVSENGCVYKYASRSFIYIMVETTSIYSSINALSINDCKKLIDIYGYDWMNHIFESKEKTINITL